MKTLITLTLIFLLTSGVVFAQSESTDVKVGKCVSFGDLHTLIVDEEKSNSFYYLSFVNEDCLEILKNKEIYQEGSDNLIVMTTIPNQDSLWIQQEGINNLITILQSDKGDSLKKRTKNMNTMEVNQKGTNNRVHIKQ